MPEYRVFVRDLDDHILSAGFTFFCEDGLDLELWCQGGRYVARIAVPRQSDKEPNHVVEADLAALLTRHKHMQIARDYIRCATVAVTAQSDNSPD